MSKFFSRCYIPAVALLATVMLSACQPGESTDSGFIDPPPSGNTPPTISGSPPSAVTIGNAYSFAPTATDPDGDALSFSVANLPGWANFDSTSGEVSGEPTPGDVGQYVDIGISVTDGVDSASLPQFSVTVNQVALGSVTLSWTPPTQNEDGSALTNLAAYKFYYGTVPGTYINSIRVDNAGIASYVIENLTPETYYFVATAVNGNGVESRFSNEATKQVP
jgi:hypothetical protein